MPSDSKNRKEELAELERASRGLEKFIAVGEAYLAGGSEAARLKAAEVYTSSLDQQVAEIFGEENLTPDGQPMIGAVPGNVKQSEWLEKIKARRSLKKD